jgi:DMSO/TMAO reductase YedYZ heme-binding membrane subunit
VIAQTQVWWFAARSSGIVAWSLLAASLLFGLFITTHKRPGGARPVWTRDLHTYLGGLATVFTGVHVASIVLDSYTHFGWTDVLVPFASTWHPLAVGWGVVAFYLLLAVEVTSLLQRSLPHALWRRVHVLSFPLYALASLHLLLAGTERTTLALRAAVLLTTMAILVLAAERIDEIAQRREQQRRRGSPRRVRV